MAEELRIKHEVLVAAVREALGAVGVPAEVAAVEAEVMAEADLMGVPSHGVRMLPLLVTGIREGRANPNPHLRVLREHAAVCLVEGDRGPGRYVSVWGMQEAVRRAEQYGIGLCLVTRVTHWGRAHAYAYRAAQAGMIGICTTNALPNMTAWGASQPVLGNNPLGIGVPRGEGSEPIVLDMAMSQAAVGKVATYLREGKSAPPGWGLDASGRPTDDPAAILASGLLLPAGGHKGAGLAFMMEVLTGVLSGGLLSQEEVRVDASGLDPDGSKFFVAIDVDRLVGRDRFASRVEDLLGYLEEGVGEPFLFPGERGRQAREQNLVEGVPIHPQIVAQLQAIGVNLAA